MWLILYHHQFLCEFLDQATAFPAMEWNPLFANPQRAPDNLTSWLHNLHRRTRTILDTPDGAPFVEEEEGDAGG